MDVDKNLRHIRREFEFYSDYSDRFKKIYVNKTVFRSIVRPVLVVFRYSIFITIYTRCDFLFSTSVKVFCSSGIIQLLTLSQWR